MIFQFFAQNHGSFAPGSHKEKSQNAKQNFVMPTYLKIARFLKFAVKKTKLATLTSYRLDFQKLANKVEIHSRSNADKILEKL